MKILVLATSYARYKGDWTVPFVHSLNKELAKKHSVAVVAPSDKNSSSFETLDGVRIYRFPYFFPRSLERLVYHGGIMESFKSSFLAKVQFPFYMLSFFMKTISVLRQEKPELIHCHWSLSALIAVLAKPFYKAPIVLTVHGADIRSMPKFLNKFILKGVDRVTTAHSEMIGLMKKLGYGRVFDVKNMLDYSSLSAKVNKNTVKKEFGIKNEKVVTFVGRLVPMKDPLTFVKAASLMKSRKIKSLVVGDGSLKSEVSRYASDSIIITGGRGDVNRILSVTDVFCAVSPLENCFSTTILEAMYLGIPCIITKAGETEKHFTHMKDSYLIRKQSPEELAKAIDVLLKNPSLRKKIAAGGKRFLENKGFTPKSVMKGIEKVYASL